MGHGPMAESIRFGDGCVRKMTCFFLARREFTALGAGRPFCFVCRVSFSAETPESMPYGDFCRAGSCFFLCAQTARTIRAPKAQVLGCRLPQIVRKDSHDSEAFSRVFGGGGTDGADASEGRRFLFRQGNEEAPAQRSSGDGCRRMIQGGQQGPRKRPR